MTLEDRDTAVGVFVDFTHAEQAIEALRSSGFPSERIGFIADDPEKMEAPPMEPRTQVGKGAAIGATVGGVLGAALGLAAAAVVLPVAGTVIVGGFVVGALEGAFTGGASGGILGALIGLKIPEQEARHWRSNFTRAGAW